jgi:hypothetical protein
MQYAGSGALQLKKKPRVFPNPGGVFSGVFPGWVYFRCILHRVFLLVYFFYFLRSAPGSTQKSPGSEGVKYAYFHIHPKVYTLGVYFRAPAESAATAWVCAPIR